MVTWHGRSRPYLGVTEGCTCSNWPMPHPTALDQSSSSLTRAGSVDFVCGSTELPIRCYALRERSPIASCYVPFHLRTTVVGSWPYLISSAWYDPPSYDGGLRPRRAWTECPPFSSWYSCAALSCSLWTGLNVRPRAPSRWRLGHEEEDLDDFSTRRCRARLVDERRDLTGGGGGISSKGCRQRFDGR